MACGFTIAGLSFQQILDQFGFLTINVDARTTISPPERVARLLSRFKPSVVVASETDFLAWMRVLKEMYGSEYKDVVNNLKVLVSTAELCSPNRSSQIERFFKIKHIDAYACVEGFFTVPCPCGEKHILPIYHTEVLSEDLQESFPFGRGRFAFTNLYRRSTPFVRYLLDDWVSIYPSICSYGFTKSIIPCGRFELTTKFNNVRYGVHTFEDIIFKDYLFGEYRVIIEPDKIHVTLEDYEGAYCKKDEIESELKTLSGMDVVVNVLKYGSLRDYRQVRKTKPILRLIDRRAVSEQTIPQYI